ncbi:MAG: hypothetical protein Q8P00_02760 [Dehalococcoidia bacterium]|nr:hypothetical protein [Dehalococcoidia bacterium]
MLLAGIVEGPFAVFEASLIGYNALALLNASGTLNDLIRDNALLTLFKASRRLNDLLGGLDASRGWRRITGR